MILDILMSNTSFLQNENDNISHLSKFIQYKDINMKLGHCFFGIFLSWFFNKCILVK